MRVSISNIAWETKEDHKVCKILHDHGIDAIDIAPGKYFADISSVTSERISSVRTWWSERGIEIIGMQSLLYGTKGLNIFSGPEIQQRMLDHLQEICRIGDGLNARRLVFGSPRNRDRAGLSDQQAFEQAISFFKRLAKVAQSHEVIICLEPNPRIYGSNFMTSTFETMKVVEAVGHRAIRMQLDTGALFINKENPSLICNKFRNYIGHIHLSEPLLVPLGTGTTSHKESASALKEFLPDFPVTIEMLTKKNVDSITSINTSIKYVLSNYCSREQEL